MNVSGSSVGVLLVVEVCEEEGEEVKNSCQAVNSVEGAGEVRDWIGREGVMEESTGRAGVRVGEEEGGGGERREGETETKRM